MMQSLKKYKTIISALAIFGAAMYFYNMFKPSIFPTESEPQDIGSDVVGLFAGLEGVVLEQSLFSSPLYRGLNNYSVELSPQPTGRSNPFNPIGQD